MHVDVFYESFEDCITTPYARISYRIIYPRTEYPFRTEAMMKINSDFQSCALSDRSFIRNSLCMYTEKNTGNPRRQRDINYVSDTKCEFINSMFMSFVSETVISSSGKTVRYALSSKTYKISSGESVSLERLLKSKDIKPLLWEFSSDTFTPTKTGYEEFAMGYDTKNFFLTDRGICIYYPPQGSLKNDYVRTVIPYRQLKNHLAYELW